MKNGSFFSNKILYNNNAMEIISLIAAVIFWFVVVINVSPDCNRTISGVKVNIDENATSLTSLEFSVIEKSAEKADVTVAGPRNVIGKLSSSDFNITPSVTSVTKAGSYDFELSAVLKLPDNRVRITKVSPSYVTVSFDRLMTKSFPVIINVKSNDIPKGYLMQTATAYPTEITVSGPASEVEKVSRAIAYVNIGSNVTGTTSVASDVVLVDSKGKQITLKHAQLSDSTVDVTVPILKMKNVPLKVNFLNVPSGVDTSIIDCSINPKSVTIAGEGSGIYATSKILLGNIDFTKLGLSATETFDIPGIDGIINVESVTSAKVSIKLKNTATRLINTSTFIVINQPYGYKVTNKTAKITGIKLYGPSSGIAKVKGVTAVINMSGVQSGTGQREVPLTFKVPYKKGFWATGSYKAVVEVSKS